MQMLLLSFALLAANLFPLSAYAQSPASTAPPSDVTKTCETALVAAGVGASSATRRVWVPQAREFNVHVGTPEIDLSARSGGEAAGVAARTKIPSFTLFDTRVSSTWDGARYQPTTRVNTIGPFTWTDGRGLRGVCASYDDAIAEFVRVR